MKDFPELYEIFANHQLMTDGGEYPDELTIRRALQLRENSPKFFVGDLATKRFFVSDDFRDLMGFDSNSVQDLAAQVADRICHDVDRRLYWDVVEEIRAFKELPQTYSRDQYFRIRNANGEIVWIYYNVNLVPNFSDLSKSLVVGTATKLNAMYLFNQARGHLSEEHLSRDIIELIRANAGSSIITFQLPRFEVNGQSVSERDQDIFLMRMGLLLDHYSNESTRCYRLKNQLFIAFVPVMEFNAQTLADEMNATLKTIASDLGVDEFTPCEAQNVFDARRATPIELLASVLGFINTQPMLNETYDEGARGNRNAVSMQEALDLLNRLSDNFSGFKYVIQPVVDRETREIKVGEVLVRSKDSVPGISPGRFVPLMEDSRMIVPFARHTWDAAVDFAKLIKAKGLDILVSVNISPMQLMDPQGLAYIRATLEMAGLSAHRFVFELTEESADPDPARTHDFLMQCRAMGILLAIDDFGEGANMLDRIFKTPFDIVKFSRNMSCCAASNQKQSAFLALLIEACRQYGAKVCMEGIEDEAMLNALQPMKADLYQGYLFSKPVEIEALLGMFE